jgi:hypothetical protein
MTLTRAERASAALCRVLDIAARVLRGLTILAIALVAAIAIAWVAWVAGTPPVRTTIPSTLVSRAFGPRSEAGLGRSVEAAGFPDRYHTEARPFEVERKALRIGPESSVGAGRVGPLVTPAGGLPPPQELAAGLERDQVSARISISAPFRQGGRLGMVA